MKMGTLSTNTQNDFGDLVQINHLSLEEITRLRKELTTNDFDFRHADEILKLLLDNLNAFSKNYQTLGERSNSN